MTTKDRARTPGAIAFVGTGPGDPGLLTLRAVEVLARADVVVLDQAPGEAVLVHARPDVEVLGRELAPEEPGSADVLTQAARAKLALTAAKAGHLVVRLMDGDPGTFGTLADEAAAAVKAGVGFEIVPGVSAVTAVPAYAGIPLTTGGQRAVHVITTEDTLRTDHDPDWSSYADLDVTLVVLGGLDRIGEVAKSLIAAGRGSDTAVAVTSHGSTTEQRTLVTTLAQVTRDLRAAKLDAPALAVIGDVVAARHQLSWFESKPLFGWRVLVPRTKEQAGALSDQLRRFGAVPEEVPTISVEPPRNPQQMEKAVRGLVEGRYEWIAFTSVNAVKAVREKFEEYGLDARAFSGLKIAAVGEATGAALNELGIKPDLVPSGEQSARGLLEDWPEYDELLDPINRVFLPRADIATETLVAGLVELGWEVDDVTAYRTVRAAPPPAPTREAIKAGKFDAVVFTSSSTVRNLVGIAGKPHACTVVACIGPATAKTAEEHGLRVDVLAEEPSMLELAGALAAFGASRRQAFLASGDAVTKPSEKKRASAKRKAT